MRAACPISDGDCSRSGVGVFGRSKLIETEEASTTALQLADASHHASTARSIRLIDVGHDYLAVGRLGDSLGDAVGRQRGALVGVERIAGNAEAKLLDRWHRGPAVIAGCATIPTRRRAGRSVDGGRALGDLAPHGGKIAGGGNA
jgi:hypothetical protein